jgi:S1-C subfamily serine protease
LGDALNPQSVYTQDRTKEKTMSKNIFVEFSDALESAVISAEKSVVLVNARPRFPASGIAFSSDLILTADHVIEREEENTIVLFDGSEIKAKVVGRDPGTDMAVYKLERAAAVPAVLSPSPARVGQLVLALGRPSTTGIESSFGAVSALGGPIRTGRGGMLERYMRTETTSYPGFSGGPLVSAEGLVLGINTSGLMHGMALTIPADLAWKIAETLAKHGHIKRGFLGIRSQIVKLNESIQKQLQRKQESGLLLVGVEEESPAMKGGLFVGDILTAINGKPVQDQDELFLQLSDGIAGKSTSVQVVRGGTPLTLEVPVGER